MTLYATKPVQLGMLANLERPAEGLATLVENLHRDGEVPRTLMAGTSKRAVVMTPAMFAKLERQSEELGYLKSLPEHVAYRKLIRQIQAERDVLLDLMAATADSLLDGACPHCRDLLAKRQQRAADRLRDASKSLRKPLDGPARFLAMEDK